MLEENRVGGVYRSQLAEDISGAGRLLKEPTILAAENQKRRSPFWAFQGRFCRISGLRRR